jgi:hypothetical protein
MRLAARTSACRIAVVASIDDDGMLDIDQIVVGVGEVGLSAMSTGPARRRIGGETNLGVTSVAAPKVTYSIT